MKINNINLNNLPSFQQLTKTAHSILRIDSSALFKNNLFSKGEVLRGYVVNENSVGNITLSVKGESIIAATNNISLKKGDYVNVKVDQLKPYIILKVLTPEESHKEIKSLLINSIFTKSGLPSQEISTADFKSLLELFNSLASANQIDSKLAKEINVLKTLFNFFNDSKQIDGEKIQLILRNSNAPIENIISYLIETAKNGQSELIAGLLKNRKDLILLAASSDEIDSIEQLLSKLGDNQALKELSNSLGNLLEKLSRHEISNLISKQEGLNLELLMPLFVEDELSLHRLKIFDNKNSEQKNKRKAINVLLDLDMSKLGQISVFMYMSKAATSVNITTFNEKVHNVIDSNLKELKQSLIEKGYNVHEITCVLKKNFSLSGNNEEKKIDYKNINLKI